MRKLLPVCIAVASFALGVVVGRADREPVAAVEPPAPVAGPLRHIWLYRLEDGAHAEWTRFDPFASVDPDGGIVWHVAPGSIPLDRPDVWRLSLDGGQRGYYCLKGESGR